VQALPKLKSAAALLAAGCTAAALCIAAAASTLSASVSHSAHRQRSVEGVAAAVDEDDAGAGAPAFRAAFFSCFAAFFAAPLLIFPSCFQVESSMQLANADYNAAITSNCVYAHLSFVRHAAELLKEKWTAIAARTQKRHIV
jgi:hypothetical protein